MLVERLNRAESDLQQVQLCYARLAARRGLLQVEESMPTYKVTIITVPPMTVAAIRETVPDISQMPERCCRMFEQIAAWTASKKLPTGPSLTIYHSEGYPRENIDAECAIVLKGVSARRRLNSPAPIRVRQLPALAQAASTTSAGDLTKQFDGLAPAYLALTCWIEDNDFIISGPLRELFYGSPQAGDLTAEIQYPVEKTHSTNQYIWGEIKEPHP